MGIRGIEILSGNEPEGLFLVLAAVGASLEWQDKGWGVFAGFHPELDEAGMYKWEFIAVGVDGARALATGYANPRRYGLIESVCS